MFPRQVVNDSMMLDILKAEDVGLVATEFLFFENRPFYPVGSLLNAVVTEVSLGTGAINPGALNDLIFEMSPSTFQPTGYCIFEILLRTGTGAAYGGWAFGSALEVTSNFASGHRMLRTTFRDETLNFAFSPDYGRYKLMSDDLQGLSTGEIRELAKSRQRFGL